MLQSTLEIRTSPDTESLLEASRSEIARVDAVFPHEPASERYIVDEPACGIPAIVKMHAVKIVILHQLGGDIQYVVENLVVCRRQVVTFDAHPFQVLDTIVEDRRTVSVLDIPIGMAIYGVT